MKLREWARENSGTSGGSSLADGYQNYLGSLKKFQDYLECLGPNKLFLKALQNAVLLMCYI